MKIRVNEDPKIEELEVIINCEIKNEHVDTIVQTLTYFDKVITGRLDGRNYTLKPSEIYYFDSTDNKVFAYTKDKVFDVNLKLYQLEDIFNDTPLIRVNKNTILNTKKISSFRSSINGRMEALLRNKEILVVSRKYVPMLKKILGGQS
jgi:DNA-binding LytR/AlgR family response regulator